MALDLEEIDRSMSFHPSEATTISCGTVTLDPDKQKVLLIWNKTLKIYQLPKGRKNIGEDMLSAAIRETYEETGVVATPLRLKIATRATPPSDHCPPPTHSMTAEEDPEDQASDGSGRRASSSSPTTTESSSTPPSETCSCEITEGRLSTEFLGCCRYPDPQSSTPAMKVVFFFAATADSTVPRGRGAPEDWERLETVWTPASEAAATLRFKAEAEIVRKALEDARRSGYPMAG
jgi:ADP-ribose pyrophosphatase YjhB (NUDIX family)